MRYWVVLLVALWAIAALAEQAFSPRFGGGIDGIFECRHGLCRHIIAEEGHTIDFSFQETDRPYEGLMMPGHATDCSSATTERQFCYEEDSKAAFIGDGTTALPLAALTTVTIHTGATATITADQMRGDTHIVDRATGDLDFTLPDAATPGLHACFYNNSATATDGFSLDPNSTNDEIVLTGTGPIGGGDELDSPGYAGSGVIGDHVCLVSVAASACAGSNGCWIMMSFSGTFADGGP